MSDDETGKRWPWDLQASERAARRRRRLLLVPLALGILLAVWCAFVLDYSRSWHAQPGAQISLFAPEARAALAIVARAAGRRMLGPLVPDSTPELRLEIEPRHQERIIAKRSEALARRFLITEADDLVPATLRFDGRAVRVRVRLKGDLTDHLEGDKWSYRVEVRGDDHVFGMRRFSLQAPYTRGDLHEPLFFDFLRAHGVLAPRFFFVDLTVNGRRLGRMAFEEHFSTELLEHQQRRDGLIVKFDEQYFYRAELEFMDLVPDYDNWRNVPVDAFRGARIAHSPLLREQLGIARGLLRGLSDGELAPSEVFDVDLLGRFLAACELWSTPHMAHWNNLRFYLNPLTLELEPVGFDSTGEAMDVPLFRCSGFSKAMMTHVVKDPVVQRAVVASLRAMRAEVASPAFEHWIREREATYLPVLREETPWLPPFSTEPIRLRAAELAAVSEETFADYLIPQPKRVMPHRSDASYPNVVQAALLATPPATLPATTPATTPASPLLELGNGISLPVIVTELWLEEESVTDPRRPPLRTTRAAYFPLPETHWPEAPIRTRTPLPFALPEGTGWRVGGRALLFDRHHEFVAVEGAPALTAPPLPRATLEAALARHPYLAVDGPGWLRIDAGTHDVVESLVLPDGVGLRLAAGTTLRFAPDAMLLARGPLAFLGEPTRSGEQSREIVLEPQAREWPGLVLLGKHDGVQWSHVVVRATAGPTVPGWGVTGGVTFQHAEVALDNTRFAGNRAEDALNTIRSTLSLSDVSFEDTASDALDADFCTGTIERASFTNSNGDGLDVSGSDMEVHAARFLNIRDKAISVGEASRLVVRDPEIVSCGTGIASKDGSEANIIGGSITGTEIAALMAYVKKSEYGGASLAASGVRIERATRIAVVQTGSRISLDGQPIEDEPLDVEALYRTGPMQK